MSSGWLCVTDEFGCKPPKHVLPLGHLEFFAQGQERKSSSVLCSDRDTAPTYSKAAAALRVKYEVTTTFCRTLRSVRLNKVDDIGNSSMQNSKAKVRHLVSQDEAKN